MDGTDGARRPAVHRGLRTAGPRIAALGLLLALPACGGLATGRAPWAAMERIAVEGERFVGARSREPFLPVGFDYGHDGEHRLLESYWASEWDRVERDLEAMRTLGATVVRIHLQLGRFMRGPDEPDPEALGRLARLLRRAEALGLRLDLTGLGAYRRDDVPSWYDALDEPRRWDVQAAFWRAVASVGARYGSVFCYDLMNEPVVPAARVEDGDWLPGEPFAGMQYLQHVTLDPAGREREAIAEAWTLRMAATVRAADPRALVTLGLVPWSALPDGSSGSGFAPARIAPHLDFLSVHVYPRAGSVGEALATVRRFAGHGPLLVEEAYPLFTSVAQMERFREELRDTVAGWIGFFFPAPWPLPSRVRAEWAERVERGERVEAAP